MQFAEALKQLRKRNGLTQEALADKLSVGAYEISPSAVGMWEQGRRIPPVPTIEWIADYFNVDVTYLLGKSKQTTIIDQEKYFRDVAKERFPIYAKYEKLSEENKKIVETLIDGLLAAQSN